jgi:hypothetical protein
MTGVRHLASVVLSCILAVAVPCPAAAQRNDTDAGRIVAGLVRDSVTRRLLDSAQVFIVGTELRTQTDVRGRFRIAGVPTTAAVIRAQLVGHGAAEVPLAPGVDSIAVQLTLFSIRSHAPLVALPPLSASEQREAWAALLREWGESAERDLESIDAGGQAVARADRPPRREALPVLEVSATGPAAVHDRTWQRDLVKRRVVGAVCIRNPREGCHQQGFITYISLGELVPFAPDSASVRVTYTDIDVDVCRRTQGRFAEGKTSLILVRSDTGWAVAGQDAAADWSIADGWCNAH